MADTLATLTGFQRDLLYVIAGGTEQSGQEIKEELEPYYSTEINHGRLYPNLDSRPRLRGEGGDRPSDEQLRPDPQGAQSSRQPSGVGRTVPVTGGSTVPDTLSGRRSSGIR